MSDGGDAPRPDPEEDLPDWAKWLRRQLNGLNLVIGGLVIVVVSVLALVDELPRFTGEIDCSNPKTPQEWSECLED